MTGKINNLEFTARGRETDNCLSQEEEKLNNYVKCFTEEHPHYTFILAY